MEKIVYGILFEGKRLDDCWEVRTWERNGVMERSVRQAVEWTEVGPCPSPLAWDDYIAQYDHDPAKQARLLKEREEEEEVKRVKSLKKSAQRAKQTCRRAIISEGFDEMLTLTYRENQLDLDLTKKHFKEWVRRMKRALPGFRYVAGREKQKRGAYHWHVSTHRLPAHANYRGVPIKAWQLGTKVWRDIVGSDNGMCFVGQKNRYGVYVRGRSSLAKMAAYVSKYIMKDFEDHPKGGNRFSRSIGNEVGKPTLLFLTNCTLGDVIEVCFECSDDEEVVSHRLGDFKDSLWFVKEQKNRPR